MKTGVLRVTESRVYAAWLRDNHGWEQLSDGSVTLRVPMGTSGGGRAVTGRKWYEPPPKV